MSSTRFFAAYFLVMLIVGVFAVSLSASPQKTVNGSGLGGFGLVAPPPQALTDPNDPDFGLPLDTGSIGLMAYYYRFQGFVLNDSIPAFQTYTEHGSGGTTYYDGTVRVWMDVTGDTYLGSDVYVDISVRLRADGWVLAWLTTSQNASVGVYWGHSRGLNGNPVQNATTPMRAIQRIYYASGLSFPGYNNMKMYDYQYSTATKLVIFGLTGQANADKYWYATIPSSTNSQIVKTLVSIGGLIQDSASTRFTFYIDGVTWYEVTGGFSSKYFGWNDTANPITGLLFDTTITFRMYIEAYTGRGNVAVLMWLK